MTAQTGIQQDIKDMIGNNDVKGVAGLIGLCQCPDIMDKNSTPLISLAVRANKPDIVKMMLESGANPDISDRRGDTPLIWACCMGHADIARMLLEHGAERNVKNDVGTTPLDGAERLERSDIVALLTGAAEQLEYEAPGGEDIDTAGRNAIRLSTNNGGMPVRFEFNDRTMIVNRETPTDTIYTAYNDSEKGDTVNIAAGTDIVAQTRDARAASSLRRVRRMASGRKLSR